MSTSEPFLPAGEPRGDDEEDARVRDLRDDPQDDTEYDVDDEPAVADADAERAADEQRRRADSTPFRRPRAGDRLSAEELADELP